MRVVTRGLAGLAAGLLFAVLVTSLSIGSASATVVPTHQLTAGPQYQVAHGLAAVPRAVPNAAPVTTAPPGPNLNQQQQAADAAKARSKMVIAVVVVVLLAIVYLGRRGRNRHKIRNKNLQNAKS